MNVWPRNIESLPEMERRFHSYFEEGSFPSRMTATTGFIDDECLAIIEGVAYRP